MSYLTIETRELDELRRKYSVACDLLDDQSKVIANLRGELERAVRDINRVGAHTATYDNCSTCNLVRTYGLDPEAMS